MGVVLPTAFFFDWGTNLETRGRLLAAVSLLLPLAEDLLASSLLDREAAPKKFFFFLSADVLGMTVRCSLVGGAVVLFAIDDGDDELSLLLLGPKKEARVRCTLCGCALRVAASDWSVKAAVAATWSSLLLFLSDARTASSNSNDTPM